MKKNTLLKNQNGNVLFMILIAVALFAALSYAITQSSTGGRGIDSEENMIIASRMLQVGSQLQQAMTRMSIVNGTADTEYSFDYDGWGHNDYEHGVPQPVENQVYHTSGGGVAFEQVNSMTNVFDGNNNVIGIGETCATADCKDLILLNKNVPRSLCIAINRLLKIDNPSGNPPVDADFMESGAVFTGTYAATADAINAPQLDGEPAGCFTESASGQDYFYYVLVER